MRDLYEHSFTVEGTGAFPYDMLRYDQCFPCTPDDTANMGGGIREQRAIRLARTGVSSLWLPTEGRWASFGWIVLKDEHVATKMKS